MMHRRQFLQVYTGMSLGMILTWNRLFAEIQKPFFRSEERVVFLGDSITFDGRYIDYLQAYLATTVPGLYGDNILDIGLPSETCSGLSEPIHNPPRPNTHERLGRALEQLKPDVLFVCYGMNDGIYHPFSEERLAKYQAGLKSVVEKAQGVGARVVVMAPPMFDNLPVEKKTVGRDASNFSYLTPYSGYDEVLTRYGEWILSEKNLADAVIDLHQPLLEYTGKRRKTEPRFTAVPDGIHPNAVGHWLMARQILTTMNWGPVVPKPIVVTGEQLRAGILEFELPPLMPRDPEWDVTSVADLGFHDHWSRLIVRIPEAKQGVELFEEKQSLGKFSPEVCQTGINLAVLEQFSLNRAGVELLKKIRQRRMLLRDAWVTRIGHKRPNTPVGLPLEEAQTKAAALSAEIDQLRLVRKVKLRITIADN